MTPTPLLLTRPRHSAETFASTLDANAVANVRIVFAPLMEISPTGADLEVSNDAVVIFTSANGVRFAPVGQGRTAYCVGTRTTEAAMNRGWRARQVGDAAIDLIEKVTSINPRVPLLHLGGAHTRGDIAENLSKAGIETRHIALYTQHLLPLQPCVKKLLGETCILPLFSPRSAEQLRHEAHGLLDHAHIVALSPAVAAPLRGENTAQLNILPKPQASYMRKEVENLCLTLSLP